MTLITKLLRKIKVFEWTAKCQTAWEVTHPKFVDKVNCKSKGENSGRILN
jgi:hypothetical protein